MSVQRELELQCQRCLHDNTFVIIEQDEKGSQPQS